ncbi:hypothetical protein F4680DRAFT_45982 [Xylaria scruposa]|nr:hypothetical protein F4680DRAFT_45982 [Xylaria scruposa]
MDPASIVQIIGTAVSLGDVVLKCISRLHSLKAKYHDAPLIICTITGQLYMVQAALDQLRIWNKPEYGRDPRYRQLALQIGCFLECFSALILTLEQRLEDFEPNSSKSIPRKQKFIFLWGEKETSEYSCLLDRQVNALNLLLQAVQCNTWAQQQDMIRQEESQRILEQAKDASSSVIGLEDASSFISENTADISMMFDFDTVLLASRIYQQVGRSHLRQAIRARNPLPSDQNRKEEQPSGSYQAASLQMNELNHCVPGSSLQSSTSRQQDNGIGTQNATNYIRTLQEQQEHATSESSSDQKETRRTPTSPSKLAGISTLTLKPRIINIGRRALRQRSDTNNRQNTETKVTTTTSETP